MKKGYYTFEDIKRHAKLTSALKIAIDHVDDFEQKIPRNEVWMHENFFRTILKDIDWRTEVTVVGSYRRKVDIMGDIDFLITASHIPFQALREQVFDRLIPELFRKNYLKGRLAAGNSQTGKRWIGAASLPGSDPVWRRVDILLAPPEEYGAALWFYTGSQTFNRGMERLAASKGYLLDNKGLWKVEGQGQNGEELTKGKLVEGRSEAKTFGLLGERWRAPENRNY